MLIAAQAIPIPLTTNADGVVLIGGTRVPLETVVNSFNQGSTAEEIAYQYTSLKLSDIYATIAFYLNNQSSVEAYMRERKKISEEVRRLNESRFDTQNIRDRLLARQHEKEANSSSY